uniref:Hypothetical chloroplast RF1 n=1 Tax=Aneura pinguis TaxID=39026 RepID=A0A1Z1G583_ANEPI|nr:hypothetical chloroplast RF1 [Aneura pinguis]WGO60875.1 hypothetical chloroplast RF1 [Aneura pinguis]WGO60961.1 hypothetical chloroplast RF1 [Aneura pinguis]
MIVSAPLSLSISWVTVLSWIKFSSGFILFGLYYGFLTTLPMGPSQLIALRAFLLEGNLGGTIAVSGLVTGQLIIFLSIYNSPFYVVLLKPHIFTLSILPYTLFYWYRIKDLLDYHSLRSITSFRDGRIFGLFLDSMIFQLLNPIVLPSPVLTRLLSLFFFRYSNNLLFLIGATFGWLYGQYSFIQSGKLLLFRVESDSPVLYLLVKRIIYRTFGVIIFIFFLLHLGRTPVPFITKKLIDNLQFNSLKRKEQFIPARSWITNSLFDHRRWKRPFRYITNSGFSTKSPVKKKVSQYFFHACLSDGKSRLSIAYLPSLAFSERNFKKYLNPKKLLLPSESLMKWIIDKERRKECIYNEFRDRINFLQNGLTSKKIEEKKINLLNFEGKIFIKIYDPLLMERSHETVITSKSPWLLAKKSTTKWQERLREGNGRIGKKNRLKSWISDQWQELEYKDSVLPWEPLTRDAQRTLRSLINKSKGLKLDTDSKLVNLSNEDGVRNMGSNETNSLSTRKRVTRKSSITWELILNISSRQRNMYFNHLLRDGLDISRNRQKHSFLTGITSFKSIFSSQTSTLKNENQFRFSEMNKEIPRWTSDLRNDRFDVIATGVTDTRQRRVKNLGYLTRGEDRRRKIVRRFSQQSDFRRELVKGSMRARRRKTLIWKIFQFGIKSPFFMRIGEKPASIWPQRDLDGSVKTVPQYVSKKNTSYDKTRTDRLAIANRWDFPLAQWGRSWLLMIQSYLRKYLALPAVIILKNISRFFLFQNPEWNKDWFEWNREIHIRCTYDGTEISEKELPEQWLRDGLQIKIINPFHLKPWHKSEFEDVDFEKNEEDFTRKLKFRYCYLTAWGFLTDLPFGDIKKQPSFWKPLGKEFRRRIGTGWITPTYFEQMFVKKESSKNSRIFDSKIVKAQMNFKEFHFDKSNIDHESGAMGTGSDIAKIRKSSCRGEGSVGSLIRRKYLYERLDYLHNLEDLAMGENTKEIEIYSHRNKDLKLARKAIWIRQMITQSYRNNLASVKGWFLSINVDARKIKTKFELWIQIVKESIWEIFDRIDETSGTRRYGNGDVGDDDNDSGDINSDDVDGYNGDG